MTPQQVQLAIVATNALLDLIVQDIAIAKANASEDEAAALDAAMVAMNAKAAQVAAYQAIQNPS
ncbi:MAG: hypothetical protein ABFD60_07735 [Bryobacteraceae bacterium]